MTWFVVMCLLFLLYILFYTPLVSFVPTKLNGNVKILVTWYYYTRAMTNSSLVFTRVDFFLIRDDDDVIDWRLVFEWNVNLK